MPSDKLLKPEERAIFMLRSLYSGFGYSPFKMGKFEEYDLYVRNKDFLISEGIITFTDTNGKLMALKPDVTLSIIKNSTDREGAVDKFYYDESVYRISGSSDSFKEITQTGLECIGDLGMYEICEVLTLAVKSLKLINDEYILDLSHAGLYAALLDTLSLDSQSRAEAASAIRAKSADALRAAVCDDEAFAKASLLLANYTDTAALRAAFADIEDIKVNTALDELCVAADTLFDLSLGARVNLDFSIVNDERYYSGVVFKGYIKGIPTEVLSGGQYDKLMKKMDRLSGAIGFAVYLDVLERMENNTDEYDFDYALLAGDSSPAAIIKKVEALSADGSTVAVFKSLPDNVRCRKVVNAEVN